ncbi:MAG: cytochrome c biogenesis protein CcdA [Nocardioides sp.]
MDTSSLLLSYSAGLVAAVNPCGFALLPAYLSLLVLGDDSPTRGRALARALSTSTVMTIGFVAVFLFFGLVISPVASSAQQHLPWVTLVLGVTLAVAGLWLLAGRTLPGLGLRVRGTQVRRGFGPVLLYGIGYAAASLTCTIAPFLAVVVSAFRAGSTGEGLLLFGVYAVGMGTVVTVAAVAVALARGSIVAGLRRTGRWTGRLVGVLLVAVGSYVAWYGAWEIRVLGGADAGDPVVERALDLQASVADLVSGVGLWWLVLLVPVVVLAARRMRRPVSLRRTSR